MINNLELIRPFKQEYHSELNLLRPITATISILSFIENNRQLNKNLDKAQDPLIKSMESLKKPKLSKISCPDKQINAMLINLDRITRNAMYGQKRAELIENEIISVELLPGESQLAYVNVRGKMCPLNIMIEKSSGGSLEIYVSKKIREPTEHLNDETFTSDYIRITDKLFFFVIEFVALNFTAIKETRFTVRIKFGLPEVTKKKKENAISLPSFKALNKTLISVNVPMKKPPEKNFIKINQTLTPIKTPKNLKDAEKKRNIVKERYRNIQIKIKEKNNLFIKKNDIRFGTENKGIDFADILKHRNNFQKFWIALIYLGKSLLFIKNKIRTSRSSKLDGILKMNAARKIQRRFQKNLEKNPIKNKIEAIMIRSLNYFFRHSKFLRYVASEKVYNCIKDSAKNKIILTKFNGFFRKVKLIQIQFRDYSVTNQIRLQELEEIWMLTLTSRIEKINTIKKKSKKWKKKMLEKYSSIDEDAKIKVIRDYLTNIKRRYLDKVKEHNIKKHERRFSLEQKKKILETELDILSYMFPPQFEYIPSNREMIDLIDSITGGCEDKDEI